MKIAATSAGTSIYYGQVIETANALRLAGQTITVSAKVAASTSVPLSLVIQYNTSVDSTASWTTVTATSGGSATPTSTTFVSMTGVYSMPSTAKTIRIGFQHSSTVASGVNTYIGQIQCEVGSTATPFQTATGTIQGELAACQRYYQKTYNQTEAPAAAPAAAPFNAINASTTLVVGIPVFKVSMRTAPTVTLYSSVTGTSGKIRSGGADITASAADVGENGIGYISATGLTAGSNSTITYVASAEL